MMNQIVEMQSGRDQLLNEFYEQELPEQIREKREQLIQMADQIYQEFIAEIQEKQKQARKKIEMMTNAIQSQVRNLKQSPTAQLADNSSNWITKAKTILEQSQKDSGVLSV